jgi:hypothetical protein
LLTGRWGGSYGKWIRKRSEENNACGEGSEGLVKLRGAKAARTFTMRGKHMPRKQLRSRKVWAAKKTERKKNYLNHF